MKKIIFILLLILAAAVFAAAAFILTFDPNRFRPQIEKQASAALGHPVKIGNLSLGWHGGVAVEADGVQVLSNDEPVLKVQSAGALVEVLPLLKRSIRVASIFVDGADIRVVKTPDGKVQIQGITAPQPQASEVSLEDAVPAHTKKENSRAALTSFFIGKLDLKNIRLSYVDDTPAFPVQLEISDIEASVKNISFFRPIDFSAAAKLPGSRQNVKVSGRVQLNDGGAEVKLEKIQAEADLSAVNWSALAEGMPVLFKNMPVSELGGKIKAGLDTLVLRDGKPGDFDANLDWENGRVMRGAAALADHLQVSIKGLRLNAPFEYKVQGDVLAGSSNFSTQGRVEIRPGGQILAGPAQIDLDLNRLDWQKIEALVPNVRDAGLQSPPEGRIHADIRRAEIQPGMQPYVDADFRYDQGRLRLKVLPQDLSPINITGTLRGDQLNLDAWNLGFGSSPAEGRVNIQRLWTAPVFKSEVKIRNLNLKNLIPPAPSGQPQPEGILSAELNLSGAGKTAEVILPSLAGSGHFRIEEPVVRNFNILEQIFAKLSQIPGLNDALNQRVSDKMRARLDRPDTEFETIDEEFSMNQGVIRLPDFEAVSPDVKVSASLAADLGGLIEGKANLWVHEEIMADLTDRVHELALALNSKGQLQVPLAITGRLPSQVRVLPDIQFILSEIVRNRAAAVAQRIATGQGAGNISQILGLRPYGDENTAAAGAASQDNTAGTAAADDSSVPVRVNQANAGQQNNLFAKRNADGSKRSNSDIAAGILGAFLADNEKSTSQNQNSGNSGY